MLPRRRCVGCGRIRLKSELLRIVATDRGSASDGAHGSARAVADPSATMHGRGAYLCRGVTAETPAEECLELATRRGGLARALRCSISDPPVTIGAKLVESVSP